MRKHNQIHKAIPLQMTLVSSSFSNEAIFHFHIKLKDVKLIVQQLTAKLEIQKT